MRTAATSSDTFWNLLEQSFSSSGSAYNVLYMDRSVKLANKVHEEQERRGGKNSQKL
jgi:hypothetical protein